MQNDSADRECHHIGDRRTSHEKLQIDVGADHRLTGWMVRHCTWILHRLQRERESDGRTSFRNMRGKDYAAILNSSEKFAYSETTMLTRQHWLLRWIEHVDVGKVQKTNEAGSNETPSAEETSWERISKHYVSLSVWEIRGVLHAWQRG